MAGVSRSGKVPRVSLLLIRPRPGRRLPLAPAPRYDLHGLPAPLAGAVSGARRALRRQQAADGALLGLQIGLGIALALALAARLWPLLDRPYQLAWSALTIALVTLLGWLAGLLQPLSAMTAARALDARLGLRERISTALELAARQAHGRLDADQAADAAVSLRGRAWQPAFRLRLARRPLLVAAGLVGLLALVLALPDPQQAALAERAATRRAVAAAAEQVAAARDRAAARRDLDAARQAALTETLTALEQDLRQGHLERRPALARLAAAEAALRERAGAGPGRRGEALEPLGQELMTSSDTTAAGRALRQDDPAGAAKELATLAGRLDRLDAGERQALASKLDRAAATQAVANPDLAASLASAAGALQAGQVAEASRQLGQAADQLRDLAAARAAQAERQRALDDLAAARQQLGSGGQAAGGAPASRATPVTVARGQGSGTAGGQGDAGSQRSGGVGQSQGSRAGQGQGSGAAGAGQGRTGGVTSPRTDGGTAGAGQPVLDRPGQTGAGAYESVYAPQFAGSSGETSQAPGRDRGQGAAERQPGQGPGGQGAPLVPYQRVYQEYRRQATEALTQGRVPPHLRDYVRDYFTSLDDQAP